MAKTVHVYPSDHGWAVRREGTRSSAVFATQREAIENAREIVRESAPSQMVVHGRNGRIREHVTHGLPRVQNPPGTSRSAKKIERAVGKIALERVTSEPLSPHG